MSPRVLPAVSGRRTVRALEKAGFVVDRIKGSHHILLHPGRAKSAVSVPVHGNRELPRGTLSGIMEQAGLSIDEFIQLLR
ncbi:type II toxin-antitoxin system HicA family toxin [Mangrovibrevibacter kandeliae]|uniref:type II toxin-antitoxin system HicA family toxin n=1 Tax=Mangrovibrevibacter kandeliae TaxID=2968473 RepID=UPI00355898A0